MGHALKSIETSKLSAKDLVLKRYIELNESIKVMQKELDILKEEIKHEGSHSTRNYVATVTTSPRTSAPALKILIEAFGKEKVMPLTKTTDVVSLKVSRKAE